MTDIIEQAERQDETAAENRGQKKFGIVKAPDPDTAKILGARMDVITDPDLRDGARNLFTLLLDLSLDSRLNNFRRGQIAISNQQLQERLTRSARAIYGWTKQLEFKRHIWVSKLGRPNTQPMNVFHITALQPKKQQGIELAGDGLWGDGYRRPGQVMPQGARGASCKKRHYLFDRFGNPLIVQIADYQPATRKECGSLPQDLRETPAQNDTCHPQDLRETPANFAGASRTKGHLPPARNDTTPQQERALLTESLDVRSRPLERSISVQRCNAFKKGGEKDFLVHVGLVMERYSPKFARQELTNSGAWWRKMFRTDPDKITRVLAEVERMIKEGETFTNNPGATAVDLWQRFA